MTSSSTLPLVVFLLVGSTSCHTPGDGAITNMSVHVADRKFDASWDAAADQPGIGIQFDQYEPGALIGYELGLFVSREAGTDTVLGDDLGDATVELSGGAADLSLGLRKTFEQHGVSTYFGAGVAYTLAQLEVQGGDQADFDESDDSVGFYAHAGVYWSVLRSALVGIDYRVLTGTEVDLGPTDDADYGMVSLFFGHSF